MKYRLLDLLECKVCKNEFKIDVYKKEIVEIDFQSEVSSPTCKEYCGFKDAIIENDNAAKNYDCLSCYKTEIIDGLISCSCGLIFPVYKAIPRLLHNALIDPEFYTTYSKKLNSSNLTYSLSKSTASKLKRTKVTFDIEWTKFEYKDEIYGHTEEEEENDFIRRTHFEKNVSASKLLLDAGCGIGRLIKRLDKYGIESFGVELSIGIDKAYSKDTFKKKIHFIQGDIADLPIKPDTFDYVYSKGVLHYTPDAKKTFKHLTQLTKKGGTLSVTLYPKLSPLFDFINRSLRKTFMVLPPRKIYYISFLLTPFFQVAWRLSGFPSRNITRTERAHMIFNWFASEFQNFHSKEEIVEWFRESGFSHIETFLSPMGVTARRK